SLIEAEVIDYKGDKLVANHQMNPDLYWALKGGGSGNFGVVTKLTYKLPEKMAMCTLVNIDYQRVSVEKVIEVASRYQQFFKDLDRRLNLKMAMYNSETKGQGVRLTGIF
ncbi:FAD-linked oxidase, partial [Acinetobacter baumannii]